MPDERFVVGELSATWDEREDVAAKDWIAAKFTTEINTQASRGYALRSWNLTATSSRPHVVVYTIVAVYEREASAREVVDALADRTAVLLGSGG